jgi:hypothetical protein
MVFSNGVGAAMPGGLFLIDGGGSGIAAGLAGETTASMFQRAPGSNASALFGS